MADYAGLNNRLVTAVGSNGYLAVWNTNCVDAKRYGTNGLPLGTQINLPMASCVSPTASNIPWPDAAWAKGHYLVSYAVNDNPIGYAVIDEATGNILHDSKFELTTHDLGLIDTLAINPLTGTHSAARGDAIGLVWRGQSVDGATTMHDIFMLLDSDGAWLAPPLDLGSGRPSGGQLVIATSDGFVVAWPKHATGTVLSTVTCH